MSGLIEACPATDVRPIPTIPLPDRGPFIFQPPYNTTGIRLTNSSDMSGQDALEPCGYSYWANINAHAGQDHLFVFLGVNRDKGGLGPSLWHVDKATHEVIPFGPLFPPEHPLSWSTGEGWYWSATNPDILYVSDLEHLYRFNVVTKAIKAVIDITPYHALGCVLWQFHTSHDGLTHSATVKKIAQDYKPIGSVVYRESDPCAPSWFPAIGDLDECQVDQSGGWLLIKENVDGQDGEDNRIVNLATGTEWVLKDRDGAAGHSDNGYGYMVAADNWNALPNAIRLWMFDGSDPQGRVVYYSPSWDVQLNHLSHCNARPGSPDGQWVIGSGATRVVGPRANEIIQVPLNGSLELRVLAPTMVDLDAAGGGDDYRKMPKANVDAAGEYVLWTSNHGSTRLDAFLLKMPAEG